MCGRHAGEQSGLTRRFAQFLVRHLLDIAADEHRFGIEPNIFADFAADEVVIAREDLNGNTVASQCLNSMASRLFGRIEEGDIALENEIAFVVLSAGLDAGQFFGSDGQDPKPRRY